jgi:hypothetical protein
MGALGSNSLADGQPAHRRCHGVMCQHNGRSILRNHERNEKVKGLKSKVDGRQLFRLGKVTKEPPLGSLRNGRVGASCNMPAHKTSYTTINNGYQSRHLKSKEVGSRTYTIDILAELRRRLWQPEDGGRVSKGEKASAVDESKTAKTQNYVGSHPRDTRRDRRNDLITTFRGRPHGDFEMRGKNLLFCVVGSLT